MGLTVQNLALAAVALGLLACSTTNGQSPDAGPPSRDAHEDLGSRDSGREDDAEAGPPFLTELSVTTKVVRSPALTLVPPFSPSIHDYYVRCGAGTNALVVSMTAAPGDQSELVLPTKSSRLPEQTLSLGVDENQAIVAAATSGVATVEYWVRCLPHEFPPLEMTLHPEAGTPPPGYYLVGNDEVVGGQLGYAMVLDVNGVPVWYESHSGFGVINVDTPISGDISFIGSSIGVPYEIQALDPPATSNITEDGMPSDPHEMRVLPGGDFLLFDERVQTGVDLTGLVIPTADGGVQTLGPNEDIYACNIVEVDKSGNVVWTWVATDHFDPVKDVSYIEPALVGPGGTALFQPFHCNSIDVDQSSGNLLVSARNMDSVFYVERPSGRVLWKMGGKTFSIDGATYVPVADPFHRQHDARLQPGWSSTCSGAGASGQVSLFDDETAEVGPARAVLYDVHVGAPVLNDAGDAGMSSLEGGSPDCGTVTDAGVSAATLAWQYKGAASVTVQGSFRITADGSRVIGWGINGGHAFTEVDVAGNDLLDFYFPGGGGTYRAIKVPLTAFDLSVLRNTAGAL
jgi:Arylsulfotransferase (ASST)